jgi:ribosomal protein S18 acetylase RimI-like enzyme
MKIRPYQPSDEEEVVRLWIDCGLVVPQNNPIRDIGRKLKVNPEWFLVGELDGKVIATCMVGYEGHRGWINYLSVSPRFQRKGYAQEIMKRAEDLLLEAGCPKINLQIRATNHKVIEFYKSIGFKVDEVVSMGKRLIPDEAYTVEK